MKKNLVLLFLAVGLIISAPLSASARGRGMADGDGTYGPGHKGYSDGMPESGMQKEGSWCNRMGLTEDQQTKMTAIRDKYRDQLSKKRTSISEARKEYHQALASDAPAKDLEKLHKKMQKEASELSELRFKIMLETRGVLTPEQRKQMGSGRMGAKVGGGRGMGPSKGMGPGMAPGTTETK